MNYYLAIDIGASNGRHIAFWRSGQTIGMREVYRFPNRMIQRKGHDCWDLEELYRQVVKGIAASVKAGMPPVSIAIDTWGVDFVLLDHNGDPMTESFAYRDHRCDHTMEKVFAKITKETLYKRTGIQFQPFNTIFQLYETAKECDLGQAADFLMIPDYLNYRLCGVRCNEYTNASTTQLLNMESRTWDEEILRQMGLPAHIFHPPRYPGTCLGTVNQSLASNIGCKPNILLCASHDTGSAFMSIAQEDAVYLSSGTWSLIGVNCRNGRNDRLSLQSNYTNEGGYGKTVRYLKNIMGLWMLQELQRNLKGAYSFSQLCQLAYQSAPFDTVIDVNDSCFLKPENMMEEIERYCERMGKAKPTDIGQYVQCICRSLAVAYRDAIVELEQLTNRQYHSIIVMGGGVKNEYLNQWIEVICKKKVIRGYAEATAIGNGICQMVAMDEFRNLHDAQEAMRRGRLC